MYAFLNIFSVFGVQNWTEKKNKENTVFLSWVASPIYRFCSQPGAAWLLQLYSKFRLIYSQLKWVYKEQSQLSAEAETDRPLYPTYSNWEVWFVFAFQTQKPEFLRVELSTVPSRTVPFSSVIWGEENVIAIYL